MSAPPAWIVDSWKAEGGRGSGVGRVACAGLARVGLARVGVTVSRPNGLASNDDINSYRDTLDGVISSLHADVKSQFVWMDPEDMGDFSSWMDAAVSVVQAKLRANAAGKSDAQKLAEIDFADRWWKFRDAWNSGRAKLKLVGLAPPGSETVLSELWNGFREDHAKLIAFYTEFKDLGGKPRAASDPGPLPDSIWKVKSLSNILGLPSIPSLSIPWYVWAGLAVVGVGVAAIYVRPIFSMLPGRR